MTHCQQKESLIFTPELGKGTMSCVVRIDKSVTQSVTAKEDV